MKIKVRYVGHVEYLWEGECDCFHPLGVDLYWIRFRDDFCEVVLKTEKVCPVFDLLDDNTLMITKNFGYR